MNHEQRISDLAAELAAIARHSDGATCPTCGRAPARASTRVTAPVRLSPGEIASLSDEALRAYCAKIAPLGDCEFFLTYGVMSEAIRADVQALAATLRTRKATTADATRLYRLKQTARADAWKPWGEASWIVSEVSDDVAA